VSEALSSAIVSHSDSDLSDFSAAAEELLDVPLLGLEAKVANEDGIRLASNTALSTTGVSIKTTTVAEVALRITTSWGTTREVNSEVSAIEVLAVHGVACLLGSCVSGEFNKGESLGSALRVLRHLEVGDLAEL
jgi:hypothetical protein